MCKTKPFSERKRRIRDFSYSFQFKKQSDNFEKLWRMKSSARVSLREWLITIPYDQEKANIIANACSELIENCIKYSVTNTYSCVDIYVIKRNIYIETLNYADIAQITNLQNSIKSIKIHYGNLTHLYIKNLENAAHSALSQLGLIKIIMETQGRLDFIKSLNRNLIHIRLKIEQ